MAIIPITGSCSGKNKDVGFQFKRVGEKLIAAGSYTISGSESLSDKGEVSGDFYVSQGFKCRSCGNPAIFQCGHCGRFVCYNGQSGEVQCPSCFTKNRVAALGEDLRMLCGVTGRGAGVAGKVDILLAIDVSKSMSNKIGGSTTRLDSLKEGAVNYIESYRGRARIGVVTFGNYTGDPVHLEVPLTEDSETLKRVVNGLTPHKATPSPLGFILNDPSLEEFRKSASPKYVVVFTDGGWDDKADKHFADAEKLKSAGITIITIGCHDAKENFLGKIASENASIFVADDSAAIHEGFARAAKLTVQ